MKEVKGYKAFNVDSTNRYGMPFTEGETYRVEGEVSFGNDGNGFHMCKSLCDVFRYFKATEEDVLVAEVTGRGNYAHRDDNYYGYYDMYAFEEITIDKFLERDEVIDKILSSPPHEVIKFIVTCRVSDEEAVKIARKFRHNVEVIKALLFYHYRHSEIYKMSKSEEECIRLVLKDGQNNNKGSKGEQPTKC